MILKAVFKCSVYSTEQKWAILESLVAEDKSDLVDNLRHTCHASLPDAAIKAQTWADITNPKSTESLYIRQAKMAGMYQWD